MATRDQIRRSVELLAEVSDLLSLRVPLAELPVWAECLGVDEMTVRLRYDSQVEATVAKYDDGTMWVWAVADRIRDRELPPCPGDTGYGPSVRLPVAELSRLESFKATAKATAEGAAR